MTDQERLKLDLDAVFRSHEELVSLIDNPERRTEMQRFINAARASQERAILEILSKLTAAVNEAGAGVQARLEYESGNIFLSVGTAPEEQTNTMFSMDEDVQRLTLRLPARLKGLIDQAASSRGVSVNGWCLRNLARAVLSQPGGRPHDWARAGRPGGRRRGQRREDRLRGGD